MLVHASTLIHLGLATDLVPRSSAATLPTLAPPVFAFRATFFCIGVLAAADARLAAMQERTLTDWNGLVDQYRGLLPAAPQLCADPRAAATGAVRVVA